MRYSWTDSGSYITEYTLVCEDMIEQLTADMQGARYTPVNCGSRAQEIDNPKLSPGARNWRAQIDCDRARNQKRGSKRRELQQLPAPQPVCLRPES